MANQLPDFLRNRRSTPLNERARDVLGAGTPPHISLQGNRFTLVDSSGAKDPIDTMYLDVCMVDQLERKSKIYYADPFNPAEGAPPNCWSDNGIAPSAQANEPQSPRCDSCELNQWGSDVSKVSGKKIKACRDYVKLACVVPGDELVYLLRLPPNSHKNLQGYIDKFKGTGVDITDVVTRMQFQEGVLGTLEFGAVGYIDQETYTLREKVLAEKQTDTLIGRTDKPRQGALPAPDQREAGALMGPSGLLPGLQNVAAPQPDLRQMPPTSIGQAAAPAETPQRRRRRTAAEMAEARAQEAQKQPAPAAPPQAPFPLNPVPTQAAPAPAQPGNGSLFGMASGSPAPADVGTTLDSLFGHK